MRRLWSEERGQASAEFMGMVFWLLLAAVFVWQLMLAAWTVNQATNAARTASRVAARPGGDAEKAARNAVSGPLRDGFHDFRENGETTTVHLKIPIILPGLTADGFSVTRRATLPS
ncbi:MAG TPA: TadE family protein [Solirubrobacteraceae bacterium]|nr:TadE family protein [Solirubrobacteraceae bacterium]